jgi:hypothetical protein
MAYDQGLAQRIREEMAGYPDLSEREMFGGIGFMLSGNMACGVIQDEMIVRIGPERHAQALEEQYTREFDFTGRPMKGWVMVGSPGYEEDADLRRWVQWGVDFATSLPPK